MKLMISKSRNRTFYYVTESFRKGAKTSSRILSKIGEHGEMLAMGISDPLAYAREEVKRLNGERMDDKLTVTESIDFSEPAERGGEAHSEDTSRNVGYLYLDRIMDKLNIEEFARSLGTKSRFDVAGAIRYLAIDRIMSPRSKLGSIRGKSDYLGDFDVELHDAYRCLTLLGGAEESLQSRLFEGTKASVGVDGAVLYYDCTNYYFEAEDEDPDAVGDEGEVLRWGLRKYGLSKEHRPNPIVQMGLFIDAKGIPLAYCLEHGSNNEQNTVIPTESRVIRDYGASKFVYCSDAGLGSLDNRFFNALSGRGYVVTHSLKGTPKSDVEAMMKDLNWRFVSNGPGDRLKDEPVSLEAFKAAWERKAAGGELTAGEKALVGHDMVYKTYPLKRRIPANFLKKAGIRISRPIELSETIYLTFSASNFLYQRGVFEKQLSRAKAIAEGNGQVGRKGPNDPGRMLSETMLTAEGEVATERVVGLDEAKIERERAFHGFYALATSLESPIEELLAINARRWRIEQSFRLLKTDFEARPAYVSTESHIRGHFAICYLALLTYRILEETLKRNGGAGFTPRQILTTLRNMRVSKACRGQAWATLYTGSPVLDALEKAFGLGLDRKHIKPKTLSKLTEKK